MRSLISKDPLADSHSMSAAASPRTPEDVDAAFAEVAERRATEAKAQAEHDHAYRSLWLAHHWPHRYERCAVVAGRHVCRRCLWFYSIAFLTLGVAFAGVSPWPTAWDAVLVWVLSIPATVEFIGGEFGYWSYNARRQVAVTSILALAVGRGFYLELQNEGNWVFWGPAIVFGLLWFFVGLYTWSKNKGQYREDL